MSFFDKIEDNLPIIMPALLIAAGFLFGLAWFLPNDSDDLPTGDTAIACDIGTTIVEFQGSGYYMVDGMSVQIGRDGHKINVGNFAQIEIWNDGPIEVDRITGEITPEADKIIKIHCEPMVYISFDNDVKPQPVVVKEEEKPQDIVVGDIYAVDDLFDLNLNLTIGGI